MCGQRSQNLDLTARQADLFFCLPQRGGGGIGVGRINLAPRKRDLPRMVFEVHRPLGQHKLRRLGADAN